jgi:hypothetical protein
VPAVSSDDRRHFFAGHHNERGEMRMTFHQGCHVTDIGAVHQAVLLQEIPSVDWALAAAIISELAAQSLFQTAAQFGSLRIWEGAPKSRLRDNKFDCDLCLAHQGWAETGDSAEEFLT